MDMNTVVVLLVAVLVIAAILLALTMATRRRQTEGLKKQFGPEYEHAVNKYGGSHKAEAELLARQKRVGTFDIHPLAAGEGVRFQEQWKQTQAEFVDAPDKAVTEADRLVKQVMLQRGYPVGDFDHRAADISVDRPTALTHYRKAHEIALKQEKGQATTEDLRQAMVHYRALFNDMLEPDIAEKAIKDDGKAKEERVLVH